MDRLTYTVTESAALLGISRTTAYECVRRGEIPSLTLGRRVVISLVAVNRMRVGGTPARTRRRDDRAATPTPRYTPAACCSTCPRDHNSAVSFV